MPVDPTAADLAAEAIALAGKATPGPWAADIASVHYLHGDLPPMAEVRATSDKSEWKRICNNHDRTKTNCVASCYLTRGKLELEQANAALIAHAGSHYATVCRAYLALLAEKEARDGG